MSTTLKVPDNIPVSWLQRLQELNPDMLMLASEPNDGTETQYMSKYFTFGDMESRLSSDLSIGFLYDAILQLSGAAVRASNYMAKTLKLNAADPYIMSSMTYVVSSDGKHFGPLSCSGYRLSSGISSVFNSANAAGRDLTTLIPQLGSKTTGVASPLDNYISSITDRSGHVQSYGYGKFSDAISSVFNSANAAGRDLTTLIPQLGSKTTGVASPLDNYISSITDRSGHVQSYGYGKFSDAIKSHIGSATKSVANGMAISSVTTTNGVVTAVGAVKIADVVGSFSRVYYKDYSQSGAARDEFDLTNLYIMKLKHRQLVELSSAGSIRTDCIYMTIEDPED